MRSDSFQSLFFVSVIISCVHKKSKKTPKKPKKCTTLCSSLSLTFERSICSLACANQGSLEYLAMETAESKQEVSFGQKLVGGKEAL